MISLFPIILVLLDLILLNGLQPRFFTHSSDVTRIGRPQPSRLYAVVQDPGKANTTITARRSFLGDVKVRGKPRSDRPATYKKSRTSDKTSKYSSTNKRGSQSSASDGSDNIEFRLRKAIRYGNWGDANELVKTYKPTRSNIQKQQPKGVKEEYPSTTSVSNPNNNGANSDASDDKIPFTLKSGRNLVYVISETCRVVNNMSAVLPLLTQLPGAMPMQDSLDSTLYLSSKREQSQGRLAGFDCSDNDVLPAVSTCIKNNLGTHLITVCLLLHTCHTCYCDDSNTDTTIPLLRQDEKMDT